eukprot:scaffold309907_cov21-Tisochrysis_lutea.AAC.1
MLACKASMKVLKLLRGLKVEEGAAHSAMSALMRGIKLLCGFKPEGAAAHYVYLVAAAVCDAGVDEGPQAVAWFLEEQLKERQVLPWTAWVLMHERRVDALVRCYGGEGGKLLGEGWQTPGASPLTYVSFDKLRGRLLCNICGL